MSSSSKSTLIVTAIIAFVIVVGPFISDAIINLRWKRARKKKTGQTSPSVGKPGMERKSS
jgi:hypothetical protein